MSPVVAENTRVRAAYPPERGSNASTRKITRWLFAMNTQVTAHIKNYCTITETIAE